VPERLPEARILPETPGGSERAEAGSRRTAPESPARAGGMAGRSRDSTGHSGTRPGTVPLRARTGPDQAAAARSGQSTGPGRLTGSPA